MRSQQMNDTIYVVLEKQRDTGDTLFILENWISYTLEPHRVVHIVTKLLSFEPERIEILIYKGADTTLLATIKELLYLNNVKVDLIYN